MGGLTSAVLWWEEWQLRILVLTSMAAHVLLFIFSSLRRFAIPGWVRSMTWLAYLAADAVAIYALATLFNRHKVAVHGGGGSSDIIGALEMMWAPVLLLHLGGHDGITAYNIEDNELWSRHLVTAASQVTVAIYVFCKSWPPGGDKRLLQAAILLFIPGVVKCLAKPWALKSASIYSLVSSSRATTARQNNEDDMYPLQEYVKRVKEFVDHQEHGNNVAITVADSFWAQCGALFRTMCGCFFIRLVVAERRITREQLQKLGKLVDDEAPRTRPSSWEEEEDITYRHSLSQQLRQLLNEQQQVVKQHRVLNEALNKLYVDLSSPYRVRLRILKYFWGISQDRVYGYVQSGLIAAFQLLYTKLKTAGFRTETEMASELKFYDKLKLRCRQLMMLSRVVLPLVSIGLFHHHQSHSEAARKNDIIDVKITYAIFSCTAALEFLSICPILCAQVASLDVVFASQELVVKWPEMVAQYCLIGYFASSKRHSNWMCIAGIFGCEDFVDQRMLCMEPCFSSATISRLVLGYLNDGWKKEIHDAPSYRRFNDHSTHWPLFLGYLEEGRHHVGLSSSTRRKRPFDESVLLWHIATDFCFFSAGSFAEHERSCAFAEVPAWKTRLPAPVSILLLGIQVLIHATRKRIRQMAGKWTDNNSHVHNNRNGESRCGQELAHCKAVLCTQMSNYMAYLLFVNPEMLLPGSRRNLFTTAHQELVGMFKGQKPPLKKRELTMKIISKLDSSSQGSPPETFIHEAWLLAQKLQSLGDEKTWEVIHGVWVEMLCFSASRCRGYLHAKALGSGGEFLSYVWLLLFYKGMETFTDKLQREDLPIHDGPSTSEQVSYTTGNVASAFEVHIDAVAASAAPSTSEICVAQEDMV